MSRELNLDFYRRRAKELLKRARAGDAEATARFARYHRTAPALHDAQLVIARENGFSSWARLNAYITLLAKSRDQAPEEHMQEILRAKDVEALAAFLEQHPDAPSLRIAPLGYTPLHIATAWPEGMELLLQAGADINAVSTEPPPSTPLRVAIGYGNPQGAKFLLDRGADPRIGESPRMSNMQTAAYGGDTATILALREHGVAVDIFGAVALQDEGLVRSLVAEDASRLSQRMCSHRNVTIPPLHLAAYQNAARMVDVLLDLGAAPETRDEQGRTAIDLALHAGRRHAYERLRARGCAADRQLLEMVGSAERSERIARLHQALVEGDSGRVVAELDADPTLLNQRLPDVWGTGGTFGATPLHWAAMFGHLPVAQLLLQRGADLTALDLTYQSTPAGWAREYRRREMVAFLAAHGKKT